MLNTDDNLGMRLSELEKAAKEAVKLNAYESNEDNDQSVSASSTVKNRKKKATNRKKSKPTPADESQQSMEAFVKNSHVIICDVKYGGGGKRNVGNTSAAAKFDEINKERECQEIKSTAVIRNESSTSDGTHLIANRGRKRSSQQTSEESNVLPAFNVRQKNTCIVNSQVKDNEESPLEISSSSSTRSRRSSRRLSGSGNSSPIRRSKKGPVGSDSESSISSPPVGERPMFELIEPNEGEVLSENNVLSREFFFQTDQIMSSNESIIDLQSPSTQKLPFTSSYDQSLNDGTQIIPASTQAFEEINEFNSSLSLFDSSGKMQFDNHNCASNLINDDVENALLSQKSNKRLKLSTLDQSNVSISSSINSNENRCCNSSNLDEEATDEEEDFIISSGGQKPRPKKSTDRKNNASQNRKRTTSKSPKKQRDKSVTDTEQSYFIEGALVMARATGFAPWWPGIISSEKDWNKNCCFKVRFYNDNDSYSRVKDDPKFIVHYGEAIESVSCSDKYSKFYPRSPKFIEKYLQAVRDIEADYSDSKRESMIKDALSKRSLNVNDFESSTFQIEHVDTDIFVCEESEASAATKNNIKSTTSDLVDGKLKNQAKKRNSQKHSSSNSLERWLSKKDDDGKAPVVKRLSKEQPSLSEAEKQFKPKVQAKVSKSPGQEALKSPTGSTKTKRPLSFKSKTKAEKAKLSNSRTCENSERKYFDSFDWESKTTFTDAEKNRIEKQIDVLNGRLESLTAGQLCYLLCGMRSKLEDLHAGIITTDRREAYLSASTANDRLCLDNSAYAMMLFSNQQKMLCLKWLNHFLLTANNKPVPTFETFMQTVVADEAFVLIVQRMKKLSSRDEAAKYIAENWQNEMAQLDD